MGSFEHRFPRGCDAEKTFGASAALGSRFTEVGSDIAFALQAVERCVDRADRDLPACTSLDFLANGYAVSIFTETHERQNNDVLKSTEVIV